MIPIVVDGVMSVVMGVVLILFAASIQGISFPGSLAKDVFVTELLRWLSFLGGFFFFMAAIGFLVRMAT